ncbi:MAG: LLM class flavin-dependent oxidoreductase [Chloroflexi bacterium]|nr:MAG: LLM class flavin-dependent oxidoreductase [Chloroflexota bacterium]TMG29446.1 MAG: LLM class flavin-dependent oxidoreductase [Chloroflexota bacterium]
MDYRQPVRFGVFVTPEATERPLQMAALADELGYEVVGVQDHPYQRRFFDTWTLLTAIAMRTEHITVFPDVANLPLRPPAVLAKAAATLDLLSGGRVELGLGAGGFWEAIKAYGGPVRTPGESVSALEEAIQVIRLIWSGQHGIRFEGKFYPLAGAHSGPVPAHPMGIWIGAYKPRMLSVVGRLADGWVPSLGYFKPADLLEGNRRIDEAATAEGRDPRSIRRLLNSGNLDAETLVSLVVDYGMDTFLVSDDPDEMRIFATEVAPKVREEVESRRSRSAD